MQYDLLVIGNGPEGHSAALSAATMNKRVAVVVPIAHGLEDVFRHGDAARRVWDRGACLPATTLQSTISALLSDDRFSAAGQFEHGTRRITMDDVRHTVRRVQRREAEIARDQLNRNGIDVIVGEARFIDAHTVEINGPGGGTTVTTENVLIATGTRPARPDRIPFDGKRIVDSEDVLTLPEIPRSLIVVGGGSIGMEYALLFATLGAQVSVVERRKQLLEFSDLPRIASLRDRAHSLGVEFHLGEEAIGVDALSEECVSVQLESGKRLDAECILYSVGRVGTTDRLELPSAGLEVDECGCLWCNEDQQTWVPHIYGAGDVVGFPPLAADALPESSVDQGRRAVCHMFGMPFDAQQPLPADRVTIPQHTFPWIVVDRPSAPVAVSSPLRSRSMAARRSPGTGAKHRIR